MIDTCSVEITNGDEVYKLVMSDQLVTFGDKPYLKPDENLECWIRFITNRISREVSLTKEEKDQLLGILGAFYES